MVGEGSEGGFGEGGGREEEFGSEKGEGEAEAEGWRHLGDEKEGVGGSWE